MNKKSIFKNMKMLIIIYLIVFSTLILFAFIVKELVFNETNNPSNTASNQPVINSQEILFNNNMVSSEVNWENTFFYYNELSENQKKAFKTLYDGIEHFEKRICVKENNLNMSDIEKVINVLYFDCPELFNVSKEYNYDIKKGRVTYVYPTYRYSHDKYERMKEEINASCLKLFSQISGKNDFEKELEIHDYIIENTTYCVSTDNCNNLYGALVENKANCNGYSSAFLYLLRKANILSAQVIGSTSTNQTIADHSWNLIKLNGQYYYIDVCWNDNIDNISHYAFFNMNYESMLSTRSIIAQKELGGIPSENNTTFNYYIKNNLVADDYEEGVQILKKELIRANNDNLNVFSFQCKDVEIMMNILEDIQPILNDIATENKIIISSCKYSTIEHGNTIIIHDFNYLEKE